MKSFNPFKMWGSYVSTIIFIIYVFIAGNTFKPNIFMRLINNTIFLPVQIYSNFLKSIQSSDPTSIGLDFFVYIFTIIYGFLAGWGIHSLISVLRR